MSVDKPQFDESKFRENLVETKAGILANGQEITPEIAENAAEHIEDMLRHSGSFLAVYATLGAESALADFGLEDRFFHKLTEVTQDAETWNHFATMQTEISKNCVGADGKLDPFKFFLQAAAELTKMLYSKLMQDEEIRAFFESHQDDPKAKLCLDEWITATEMTNRFQLANQFLATGGNPPIPPNRGIDDATAQTIVNFENRKLILTAEGGESPDGGDDPDDPNTSENIFHLDPHNREVALLASSESSPPPPDPNREHEKVVPENLHDIFWPNGDSLHFNFVEMRKDSEGRERRFYEGSLRYKPENSVDYQLINLSTYIPNKKVLFEGTAGSLTGATLSPEERKQYAGWANDSTLDQQGEAYLTALNLGALERGPESLSIIFHELGHTFLFGEIQKSLLGSQPKNFLERLTYTYLPAIENNGEPEIAGLGRYRAETERIRSELMGELDANSLMVRGLLSQGEDISSSNFYKLYGNNDTFKMLTKIFQERYAGAFAVKQIRRLRPRTPSDRFTLDHQLNALNFYANKFSDTRFEEGVK